MSELIPLHRILPDLAAVGKKELLVELATAVHGEFSTLIIETLALCLAEREEIGTTGIGDGIALPHATIETLDQTIVFCARSRRGIAYEAQDNKVVKLFFLLLAPAASSSYLTVLARLSRAIRKSTVQSRLLAAPDAKTMLAVLAEAGL